MAKIPEARAGLVFRYRYLRVWQYERGEQTGKDRPCCILVPLEPGQVITGSVVYDETSLSPVERHVARESEVLILLIQSDRPGRDQLGIELSLDDKRYIGLPAAAASYVIVSEVNVDRWPNGDLGLVPGRQTSLAYPRLVPGPTMSRIAKAFSEAHGANQTMVLVRHP